MRNCGGQNTLDIWLNQSLYSIDETLAWQSEIISKYNDGIRIEKKKLTLICYLKKGYYFAKNFPIRKLFGRKLELITEKVQVKMYYQFGIIVPRQWTSLIEKSFTEYDWNAYSTSMNAINHLPHIDQYNNVTFHQVTYLYKNIPYLFGVLIVHPTWITTVAKLL